jgi:hypothetical protein
MKLFDIIGLPKFDFLEPAFNVLPDEAYTDSLLMLSADKALMVVDEEEWPVALAVRTEHGWKGANFILRGPTVEVVERYEELGGEVMETTQEAWMRGTREMYSLALQQLTPPSMEDFSPERASLVKKLIEDNWGEGKGAVCLDCGCGSGMGAAVLRGLGFSSLAYDNDPSQLSLGLAKGRLLPEETMLIDASLATHYLRPSEYGLALMAGTINEYTALVWKGILKELMDLCQETMVTVESQKEADLVRLWALGAGRRARIVENMNDAFYDRWICLIED